MSLFNRTTHSQELTSLPSSHDVFISSGKNLGFPFPDPFNVSSMLPEHTHTAVFPITAASPATVSGLEDCRGQWRGMLNNKNEDSKNIFVRVTNPNKEGSELNSLWVSPGLSCCFPESEHTKPHKVWVFPICSLKLSLQVKPGTTKRVTKTWYSRLKGSLAVARIHASCRLAKFRARRSLALTS